MDRESPSSIFDLNGQSSHLGPCTAFFFCRNFAYVPSESFMSPFRWSFLSVRLLQTEALAHIPALSNSGVELDVESKGRRVALQAGTTRSVALHPLLPPGLEFLQHLATKTQGLGSRGLGFRSSLLAPWRPSRFPNP